MGRHRNVQILKLTVDKRCQQALRWLIHEYPCGRNVKLGWRSQLGAHKKRYDGETVRRGKTLWIILSRRECYTYKFAIDTVIHEFCHCIQWGMAAIEANDRVPHHPPSFWAQYGEIRDRFDHDNGSEESRDF